MDPGTDMTTSEGMCPRGQKAFCRPALKLGRLMARRSEVRHRTPQREAACISLLAFRLDVDAQLDGYSALPWPHMLLFFRLHLCWMCPACRSAFSAMPRLSM